LHIKNNETDTNSNIWSANKCKMKKNQNNKVKWTMKGFLLLWLFFSSSSIWKATFIGGLVQLSKQCYYEVNGKCISINNIHYIIVKRHDTGITLSLRMWIVGFTVAKIVYLATHSGARKTDSCDCKSDNLHPQSLKYNTCIS
jgi:hypothetical protein